MARTGRHGTAATAWRIVREQHGVIAWWQLRALGFTRDAIAHRLAAGRLFRIWPGVYAVGRPEVSRLGRWKAATLACGSGYALDGESGMALFGIRDHEGADIEVAGPGGAGRQLQGIALRRVRGADVEQRFGVPVLALPMLFVSLASRLGQGDLEAALNEADKRDLLGVGDLRAALDGLGRRRGVAKLRRVIDVVSFRYTDSELERAMRAVFRAAGIGTGYRMQERVNGYRVDFYFPDLDLVIETDGGRFHRTAFQQRNDRRRDQAHTLAGTAFLRFTHGQIRFETAYVEWAIRKKAGDLTVLSGDSSAPGAA